MKGKSFLILLVFATIVVAAAVLSTRKQQESVPEAVGKPFLPEIDMAASVRIVISTREATSTIELKNGSWVVAEKHGFPADIKKLRNAISSLKDIKISDVPRLSPAQREQLGVVAPPGGNEHSASITFSMPAAMCSPACCSAKHTCDRQKAARENSGEAIRTVAMSRVMAAKPSA